MANEPDGGRDNLDVIRELLRRLEEAAHSRSLASPDAPHNANRELASLQQRSPPTRLSPSSPPSERSRYPSLQAVTADPVARWRLPIVAIGGYALGVLTTVVTMTYYDRVAQFAADVWSGQDVQKVAMNEPALGNVRKDALSIKEKADQPTATVRTPVPSTPPASSVTVTRADTTPRMPATSAPPQPPRSDAASTATSTTSASSATASVSPPATTPAAPTAPEVSPEKAPSANDASKSAAAIAPVAAAPVASTPQTDPGPPQIKLKVASRIDTRGGQRTALPVELEPLPTDSDALLLVMRGVPDEIALSQGSSIGNEIWLIPAHMSRDIEFTVAEAVTGTYDLTAELVTLDGRLLSQARTRIVATPTLVAAPATPAPAPPEKLDSDTIRRLTARGELLLDTGDIGAARIVLERAAEAGSAIAALRLGETYDPVYLRRSGTSAEAGDEAQALRWYERAQRLGSTGAAERLGELRKR